MEGAMLLNGTYKGNIAVSWTGRKDGCYACYRDLSEGYQVAHLSLGILRF
jgi:hypothetical protein